MKDVQRGKCRGGALKRVRCGDRGCSSAVVVIAVAVLGVELKRGVRVVVVVVVVVGADADAVVTIMVPSACVDCEGG